VIWLFEQPGAGRSEFRLSGLQAALAVKLSKFCLLLVR
jgi:hypothetical protein